MKWTFYKFKHNIQLFHHMSQFYFITLHQKEFLIKSTSFMFHLQRQMVFTTVK